MATVIDIYKTQFYRHKQLYYDNQARKWSSERVVHPVVDKDNDFICSIPDPDIPSHPTDEQTSFLPTKQQNL